MNKLSLTLLVSVLCVCVLPAAAQHQGTPRTQANQALETQVERAVAQAKTNQHKPGCPCTTRTNATQEEPLSVEELIDAEEELMSIRNRDIYASFETYPYLLDPAYRRRNDSVQTKVCSCSYKAQEQEEEEALLPPDEMIEAEEELEQIRSTFDPNATFEKYPYLLAPAYRRAGETTRQNIRRQYQSTWARKVGL